MQMHGRSTRRDRTVPIARSPRLFRLILLRVEWRVPMRQQKTREKVIYCRYSSDLQRVDSNADQERRCRDGLTRKGIADEGFVVICDEAISGTSEKRPGLDRIMELMRAGQLGMPVVSEQSRFSHGDNAKATIKDIVFHGGRFISIAEDIDTDRKGWQMHAGISELHHARSNKDSAERVRGGQEGRILDGNGSAGDFPFGYASVFTGPKSALKDIGRGARPRQA